DFERHLGRRGSGERRGLGEGELDLVAQPQAPSGPADRRGAHPHPALFYTGLDPRPRDRGDVGETLEEGAVQALPDVVALGAERLRHGAQTAAPGDGRRMSRSGYTQRRSGMDRRTFLKTVAQ